MIDTRLLLDDFDATARRLARKGVPGELLESARDLAERRREQRRQVEVVRAEMNSGAAQVGALMREGQREDAEALRARLVSTSAGLDVLEAERRATEAEFDDLVMRIPNLPADDAPDGLTEADNVVLRTHGYHPGDYEGREWAPH